MEPTRVAFVPLVVTPAYNATKAAIHSYTQSPREALEGRRGDRAHPWGCRRSWRLGRSAGPGITRWRSSRTR